MERKISEIFEFEGKKLQVKESNRYSCDSCFFEGHCSSYRKNITGECEAVSRGDDKAVIFVEVQEQPQETEEIKERKVGEVFEYQGKKFKVAEELVQGDCVGCYFFEEYDCGAKRRIIGECERGKRNDNQGIIFVDIIDDLKKQSQEQAEQPQDEQPQKLNLCEVLKYCPIGTKFWSPLLGEVELSSIHGSSVSVRYYTGGIWDINSDGTTTLGSVTSPEIMLFPSREQRDWTKVKYEPKKERFDPKTLKSFDRVITRNEYDEWTCTLFSRIGNKPDTRFIYVTCESVYEYCIPYNDETKHLVGTKDEAPVFYRYWED